jgi:phage replication-related protein YjqB (UPF0714/DUF867 family)
VFADLLAHPGVEEQVELRSGFGFMAFHGGSLERVTDEIADAAAEAAGASRYVVRLPEGFRWHVPSQLVDPAQSPALARFLDHVEVAVAVHGYGRDEHWTTLLLGGQNRDLAAHLGAHLRTAVPQYEVVDDVARIPATLRGLHPANPVNRPPGAGVQLELPPRIRGIGPHWADHDGRPVPHTMALVEGLAAAARSWPGGAPPAQP